jgi:hypothetical protein
MRAIAVMWLEWLSYLLTLSIAALSDRGNGETGPATANAQPHQETKQVSPHVSLLLAFVHREGRNSRNQMASCTVLISISVIQSDGARTAKLVTASGAARTRSPLLRRQKLTVVSRGVGPAALQLVGSAVANQRPRQGCRRKLIFDFSAQQRMRSQKSVKL